MIKKYNIFYENLLLENNINESVIYFSEKLNKTFKYINDDISKDLMKIQATNISQDVTMVDISKDGYFSYFTERNAINNINNVYPSMPEIIKNLFSKEINRDNPDDYTHISNFITSNNNLKSKNKIKIGRLINKLFPNKYNSIQLEDFTEKIKASIEKFEEHFELVEGEDIGKWYWCENYSEMSGTLGNSCMAKKRNIFDIYNKNKDVCKLLILLKDNKLIGRALVWKLDKIKTYPSNIDSKEIVYFMDRQYTIYQSDVVKFRNYADNQGWCYKKNNNHYSYQEIIYKNYSCNSDMTVRVKLMDYNKYPYMDTFRRYDPSIGILYNDEGDNEDFGNYILDDTSGGYTEIKNTVWSDYASESIPVEDAVWSEAISDYLWICDSVEIKKGLNEGWYPNDHAYVVKDIDGDYIHIDDSVRSDILDGYILAEDSVSIINYISDYGKVYHLSSDFVKNTYINMVYLYDIENMFWYKHVSNRFEAWLDYDCIEKDLLTYDYKEEYILKDFAENTYKVKDSEKYLSKVDALILNKEINLRDERIVDLFDYTINIVNHEEIFEKGTKLKKLLSDNLEGKNQLYLKFGYENDEIYIKSIENKIDEISKRLKFIKNF